MIREVIIRSTRLELVRLSSVTLRRSNNILMNGSGGCVIIADALNYYFGDHEPIDALIKINYTAPFLIEQSPFE